MLLAENLPLLLKAERDQPNVGARRLLEQRGERRHQEGTVPGAQFENIRIERGHIQQDRQPDARPVGLQLAVPRSELQGPDGTRRDRLRRFQLRMTANCADAPTLLVLPAEIVHRQDGDLIPAFAH